MSSFKNIILTLAGLLLAVRLIHHFLAHNSTLGLPPGPKPIPLLGNLHQVPKSLQWLHFYHWSKKYGPVMHLSMAGKPLILLSTHEAAQDLLSRRSAQYSDRPRSELVSGGMHLLLRQYDAAYRLHKRMEAPMLNFRSSQCYRPIQELEARQLVGDILEKLDDIKGVNFHKHSERAMASTIYCLLYGYRLKTGHEPEFVDAQRVQAEFKRTGQVGTYIVDSVPILNHLPRALAPWKKEGAELHNLERNLHLGNMNKGLSNPGWNFTKYMWNSAEAKSMSTDAFAFDVGVIADAALDTATVALDWFIVAWAVHGSRFIAKAQQMIDDVVGRDRMPQFEDRERLTYVDAIVNEILRWRPVVVGGVPHFTKEEDTYTGYRIPAGSTVMGNHFAITRDERVFGEDVDSFKPERWLDESGTLKDLPQTGFGFGRRICTGRYIALNGLFIAMVRLLWAFDIEDTTSMTGESLAVDDMAFTEGFVTMPKAFRAKFSPRGPWVRDVVLREGATHDVDHTQILDKAGEERVIRI